MVVITFFSIKILVEEAELKQVLKALDLRILRSEGGVACVSIPAGYWKNQINPDRFDFEGSVTLRNIAGPEMQGHYIGL
jgi:hypothetical protein